MLKLSRFGSSISDGILGAISLIQSTPARRLP